MPKSHAQSHTVAIIPARGGSKGLPGKNIKPLANKPLIVHTIEAAVACDAIDAVWVTTDDVDITAVVQDAIKDIPKVNLLPPRPENLANDRASAHEVLVYVVDWLTENAQFPEHVVWLQPTSPLRTVEHLNAAFSKYNTLQANASESSLVSVCEAKPASWTFDLNNQGALEIQRDVETTRQRAAQRVVLNGAIYISPANKAVAQGFVAAPVFPFMMATTDAVDIDTADDFQWAQTLYDLKIASVPA